MAIHDEFTVSRSSTHQMTTEVNIADESDEKEEVSSIVKDGLSQLGTSADGTSHVFLNLILVDKNLDNLNFLRNYSHLQILDLSHNFLTHLDGLQYLPHLISLNVSNNQLSTVFDETCPESIREANFSGNEIECINDLSRFTLLNTLLLDYNSIKDITPIQNCKQMKNLSLSFNQIEEISGLDGLPIRQLDLGNNKITELKNIHNLKHLQYINLSNNKVRSLKGLQQHPVLEEINLQDNEIVDMVEFDYLKDLKLLRILNLNNNPIQELLNYRLSALFKIPHLVELDCAAITAEEKVSAKNVFNPSKELIASRDYMKNLMLSYQQPQTLLNSSLSTSDPYPMLILVGPTSTGKKEFARRLAKDYPQYFGACGIHTTKASNKKISNGIGLEQTQDIRVTKDEFQSMKEQGMFLQTCNLYGYEFGISRHIIEEIATQGLACVFAMELEGLLTMKQTHFEPVVILMLPKNIECYRSRLLESSSYSEDHVNTAMHRIDLYVTHNQNHPGFFDDVIISDDKEECYSKLRSIMLAYLGLNQPNHAAESNGMSNMETKASFRNRFLSREKVSSPFLRNASSASFGVIESEINTPAARLSYERRYNKSRSAILGVTSSCTEQIRKINTPASTSKIPAVSGSEDLLKDMTKRESLKHFSRGVKHPSFIDENTEKKETPLKIYGEFSSSMSLSEESECLSSESSAPSAEVSSSDLSVL